MARGAMRSRCPGPKPMIARYPTCGGCIIVTYHSAFPFGYRCAISPLFRAEALLASLTVGSLYDLRATASVIASPFCLHTTSCPLCDERSAAASLTLGVPINLCTRSDGVAIAVTVFNASTVWVSKRQE